MDSAADANPVSYREKNHWNSDFDVDGIAPPDGHPVTFDVDFNSLKSSEIRVCTAGCKSGELSPENSLEFRFDVDLIAPPDSNPGAELTAGFESGDFDVYLMHENHRLPRRIRIR